MRWFDVDIVMMVATTITTKADSPKEAMEKIKNEYAGKMFYGGCEVKTINTMEIDIRKQRR